MSCLGIHFSLSEDEVQHLYRLETECERLEYIHAVIEPECFNQPERKAESDKAWEAIHRALAGGELSATNGACPLSDLVLGGELLCPESDQVVSLKTPEQVRDVAALLPAITESEFREQYWSIPVADYRRELSAGDLAYTWEWFKEVRDFWLQAADEGRYVLFVVEP